MGFLNLLKEKVFIPECVLIRMTNKVRVNITVDGELLEKAKTKLHLFGGKLSTLFNAYLKDFVKTSLIPTVASILTAGMLIELPKAYLN